MRLSPAEQNQCGCLPPPQFQPSAFLVWLVCRSKTLLFFFFYLSAVSFFAGGELLFFESLDSNLGIKAFVFFSALSET